MNEPLSITAESLATDIVAAMAERENIRFSSTKEETVSWLGQK